MLSVIRLSVIMLSVIRLSVIMLSVILLCVIMLNVVMLSVVTLNVVANIKLSFSKMFAKDKHSSLFVWTVSDNALF
jgi:hypothetical protein